jgi:CheY-specific phosphatase CheX
MVNVTSALPPKVSAHLTVETCQDKLISIVENVFRLMLNTEVLSSIGTCASTGNSMTALIEFTGAYPAALLLQCSTEQARQIARLFMGPDSEEESRDAMMELLNMVAGNLKVILPAGTQTTLPAVIEDVDRRFFDGTSSFRINVLFKLGDETFRLIFTEANLETNTIPHVEEGT